MRRIKTRLKIFARWYTKNYLALYKPMIDNGVFPFM